jgi:hypothetical protein
MGYRLFRPRTGVAAAVAIESRPANQSRTLNIHTQLDAARDVESAKDHVPDAAPVEPRC